MTTRPAIGYGKWPRDQSEWRGSIWGNIVPPNDIILAGLTGGPSKGFAANDFDQLRNLPTFENSIDPESNLPSSDIDNTEAIYNASTTLYEPSTGGAGNNAICLLIGRIFLPPPVAGVIFGKRNVSNYYTFAHRTGDNGLQVLMKNDTGVGSPSTAGGFFNTTSHASNQRHDLCLHVDAPGTGDVSLISELVTETVAIVLNTWESMLATATTLRFGQVEAGGGGPANDTQYTIGYLWEGTIPTVADIEGMIQ